MKLPQWPLQAALQTRLKADLTTPVYDEVPDGTALPYIVLGDDTGSPYGNKLSRGQEVTTTLHIWSKKPGMAEVKKLMDQVVRSVTRESLNLGENFRATRAAIDINETLRDPNGWRHGVLRFRFKILEV